MDVAPDGSRLGDLVKRAENGEIPLRVAEVHSFADAAAAHDRLAQGGVRGAVAVIP